MDLDAVAVSAGDPVARCAGDDFDVEDQGGAGAGVWHRGGIILAEVGEESAGVGELPFEAEDLEGGLVAVVVVAVVEFLVGSASRL